MTSLRFRKRISEVTLAQAVVALFAAALAGCAGSLAAGPAAGPSIASALQHAPRSVRPASGITPDFICPHIWASSNTSSPYVQGYKYTGAACPGATLTGDFSAAFTTATGLAVDFSGYLYVADANPTNPRVVVFNSVGVPAVTMSVNANPGQLPYSVCVSRTGIVAVVDRSPAGTPDVEFFTNMNSTTPTSASFPTNSGPIVSGWCAFDSTGDLFVDYANYDANGNFVNSNVGYVYRTNVNTNTTVTSSAISSTSVTYGSMFVSKDGSFRGLLSVIDSTNTVQHFAYNHNTGVPSSTSTSPSAIANTAGDTIDQITPLKAPITYFADPTHGAVGGDPRLGGPPWLFATVPAPMGVATDPASQW